MKAAKEAARESGIGEVWVIGGGEGDKKVEGLRSERELVRNERVGGERIASEFELLRRDRGLMGSGSIALFFGDYVSGFRGGWDCRLISEHRGRAKGVKISHA